MLSNLVRHNRSCRRFYQNQPIRAATLRQLVDLGRLSASGANLQPLKYIISCHPLPNAAIFENLAWAGYLKQWPGPEEGERPAAYIIILADTAISRNPGCDHGIAAQSILLGAREKGLGGCIIGTVRHEQLREKLDIPAQYKILLVLALGKPKEDVVIEPLQGDASVKYWRDSNGLHHVPKRELEDVIIGSF